MDIRGGCEERREKERGVESEREKSAFINKYFIKFKKIGRMGGGGGEGVGGLLDI